MFIDIGFMRHDEGKNIREIFTKKFNINLVYIDAKDRFSKKSKV